MALSSIILERQQTLTQRLEGAHYDDAVLRMDDVYAALTADIIAQYAWGISHKFLEDKNFRNDIRIAVGDLTSLAHFSRFFPVLSYLPRWLMAIMKPGSTALLEMQDTATRSHAHKSGGDEQNTIFDALTDPSVPPEEKTPRRLEDEGMLVIIAGTETTARALTVASYHLFQNRQLMLKLRDEIRTVMPTPTTEAPWLELEQLPYMSGVVSEALRLSYGPIFRSTRVAPTESLIHKDLVIPPGTPISMCTYFVHMDPRIFPEPESFKPERWIEAAKNGEHLNRFLVSFSKGSRICLGMNLAYAELYMTLATVVRRFDLELYETGPEDIHIGRDRGVGEPEHGELRMRAKVTKVLAE
ncbi:hypothetical protein Hte_002033 [Hypoxylon texense]